MSGRTPAGDNKSKTDDPACRAKCLTRERFSKSVCRFVWSSGARCAPRLNASARRDHHATVRRNAATAEWRTRRVGPLFLHGIVVLLPSYCHTAMPSSVFSRATQNPVAQSRSSYRYPCIPQEPLRAIGTPNAIRTSAWRGSGRPAHPLATQPSEMIGSRATGHQLADEFSSCLPAFS